MRNKTREKGMFIRYGAYYIHKKNASISILWDCRRETYSMNITLPFRRLCIGPIFLLYSALVPFDSTITTVAYARNRMSRI